MKRHTWYWVLSASSAADLNVKIADSINRHSIDKNCQIVSVNVTPVTNRETICPYEQFSVFCVFEALGGSK